MRPSTPSPFSLTTPAPNNIYTPKVWFKAIHDLGSKTIHEYASTHKTEWDTRNGIATNKRFQGTYYPGLSSADAHLFENKELLVIACLENAVDLHKEFQKLKVEMVIPS